VNSELLLGNNYTTPTPSSFAADANTVLCTPMDMQVLSKSMDEMVRLHDMGRFMTCVAPTTSFGLLHPKLNIDKEIIGINDCFKVNFGPDARTAPATGRK
jgi:hypothetical protein